MVKITKVYTRKGDKGQTNLVGGREIPKDDQRIEAYGTVDELNSILGIVRSLLIEENLDKWSLLLAVLQAIQQKLFDLGSELATHVDDEYEGQIKIIPKDITWLETIIDRINQDLPDLESFVLPGGYSVNAFLHQARTVCRRAERQTIRLNRQNEINPATISFLNRLSDLLFVLARWVSAQKQISETLWQPGLKKPDWEKPF